MNAPFFIFSIVRNFFIRGFYLMLSSGIFKKICSVSHLYYLRSFPFHEKRLRLLMQSIKNGAGKCGI